MPKLTARYIPGHPQISEHATSLASNENSFGPSPLAMRRFIEVAPQSHLYPDPECSLLRGRLAARLGLSEEQILIGAGSTQLIYLLASAYLQPGESAVAGSLSFLAYALATETAGAQLLRAPMKGYGIDLDGALQKIDASTRLVFLANPNNPTGSCLLAKEIDRFLDALPSHCTLVLDEAYHEYASFFYGGRYSRALEYLREGRRVIVLRTFSKAHGLAGLRVGYALGAPSALAPVAAMRPPFSVPHAAEQAAIAALEDDAHIQGSLTKNARSLAELREGLFSLGIVTPPSAANFLFAPLNQDAARIAQRLKEEDIWVRPLGPWGAPQAIRITSGTSLQNQKLFSALAAALTR